MNFQLAEKLMLFFGLFLLACNTPKENLLNAKSDNLVNIIFIMSDDRPLASTRNCKPFNDLCME